ncbi:hypothetical protein B0H14DRAFT_2609252 [Mycena olivaceomarginata]|nr:hypothetical protein B0H14DRAFT_2609252 [Mycena olivaceomarginata]
MSTSTSSSTSSSRSAANTAGRSLTEKPATPEPPKAAQNKTTRSATNAAQIYLDKTKKELLGLTTSDSHFTEWTSEDVKGSLHAKGFITEAEGAGTRPSFSLLAFVVLRVAASLPPNAAVAADALRAVAVCMESKRADLTLEGISTDLTELSKLCGVRRDLNSSGYITALMPAAQ